MVLKPKFVLLILIVLFFSVLINIFLLFSSKNYDRNVYYKIMLDDLYSYQQSHYEVSKEFDENIETLTKRIIKPKFKKDIIKIIFEKSQLNEDMLKSIPDKLYPYIDKESYLIFYLIITKDGHRKVMGIDDHKIYYEFYIPKRN